jgi:hypothetical protein
MRAVTDDPRFEQLMADLDRKKADLEAANRCAEFLPHRAAPGACDRCGTQLTGRQRRWCSRDCEKEWLRQHHWDWARNAAKQRDGQQCVRDGCTTTWALEVNHIEPRVGRGYGFGCHNHLANLETLCRPHHIEVTTQQRRQRQPSPALVPSNQGELFQ